MIDQLLSINVNDSNRKKKNKIIIKNKKNGSNEKFKYVLSINFLLYDLFLFFILFSFFQIQFSQSHKKFRRFCESDKKVICINVTQILCSFSIRPLLDCGFHFMFALCWFRLFLIRCWFGESLWVVHCNKIFKFSARFSFEIYQFLMSHWII